MSENYKHQKRAKKRAESGKAINEIFNLPQIKYRQGVNPNNGKKKSL